MFVLINRNFKTEQNQGLFLYMIQNNPHYAIRGLVPSDCWDFFFTVRAVFPILNPVHTGTCTWLKETWFASTAPHAFTGMFTSPNEMAPIIESPSFTILGDLIPNKCLL